MRPILKPMFEPDLSDFFMVFVYSNVARYKRRTDLFRRIIAKVEQSGADHVVVELALGDRQFDVTRTGEPHHLQLRTIEEFWHKESCINEGIRHGRQLWPSKKNVGWCDGDSEPVGRSFAEWFEETWHELQHFKFVQMWSTLQPMDFYFNALDIPNPSFMANYINHGTPYPKALPGYPKQWGSPGLAWAANISAIDEIGGIPDAAILGAGDWYLAHMLISDLPFSDFKSSKYSQDYMDYWSERQALCEKWIKRDVGFVQQLMTHYFHGRIQNRGYATREKILIDNQFAPSKDLKRGTNGVWQLETHDLRQIKLRDQVRRYFRLRNEDSIDL